MTNQSLDRICGILFSVLGISVLWGALSMPRFEAQGASIYQAPGLTPGLLGAALALCGVILAIRPVRPDAKERGHWDAVFGVATHRKRAAAALFWTLFYGAVLFGNAPYILATFVFVAGFILTFEWLLPADDRPASPLRSLVAALILGASVAFGTSYVFQSLFLVQLP